MEFKKKFVLLSSLYILLSLVSCSLFQNVKVVAEEDVIEENNQYFLPNTDGYVYITDDFYLGRLYNWSYDSVYSSFEEFQRDAVSSSINLDYKTIQCDTCVFYYYYDRFKIDNIVMAEYKENGFSFFKDMYCQAEDSSQENDSLLCYKANPDTMDKNKKLTIAYCLWLNGYHYHSKACFNNYYFSKIGSSKNQRGL